MLPYLPHSLVHIYIYIQFMQFPPQVLQTYKFFVRQFSCFVVHNLCCAPERIL
jgi:hypothetical protein